MGGALGSGGLIVEIIIVVMWFLLVGLFAHLAGWVYNWLIEGILSEWKTSTQVCVGVGGTEALRCARWVPIAWIAGERITPGYGWVWALVLTALWSLDVLGAYGLGTGLPMIVGDLWRERRAHTARKARAGEAFEGLRDD
jgi:hypothetical protein